MRGQAGLGRKVPRRQPLQLHTDTGEAGGARHHCDGPGLRHGTPEGAGRRHRQDDPLRRGVRHREPCGLQGRDRVEVAEQETDGRPTAAPLSRRTGAGPGQHDGLDQPVRERRSDRLGDERLVGGDGEDLPTDARRRHLDTVHALPSWPGGADYLQAGAPSRRGRNSVPSFRDVVHGGPAEDGPRPSRAARTPSVGPRREANPRTPSVRSTGSDRPTGFPLAP